MCFKHYMNYLPLLEPCVSQNMNNVKYRHVFYTLHEVFTCYLDQHNPSIKILRHRYDRMCIRVCINIGNNC